MIPLHLGEKIVSVSLKQKDLWGFMWIYITEGPPINPSLDL